MQLLVHLRELRRRAGFCFQQRSSVFQLQLAFFRFPQQLRLALQLSLFDEQVHEHRDLRAQHIRIEGLEHVIDGAHRIALEDISVFLADGAEENDRNGARSLARLDDLGYLEAVHPRHLHVEQNRRELPFQHAAQRVGARIGANQSLTERLQNPLQRQEILRSIVHDENLDRLVAHTAFLLSA